MRSKTTAVLLCTGLPILGMGYGTIAAAVDQARLMGKNEPHVERRSLEALPEAIARAEKAFGIEYGRAPQLAFGTPGTGYKNTAMTYDAESDTITVISRSFLFEGQQPLFTSIIPLAGSTQTLEDTLTHEAGHAYKKRVIDELEAKGRTVPDCINNFDPACTTVSEGIAEYFMYASDQSMRQERCTLPETAQGFLSAGGGSEPSYPCGHVLVAPILRQLGVREGIARTVLHPPTEAELFDMPAYQQRVLALKSVLEHQNDP